MNGTQIQPHDHVVEAAQSAVHPASPVRRRGYRTMVLTRRGWRTVTHLNALAESCRANGVDPASAFRFLGLA